MKYVLIVLWVYNTYPAATSVVFSDKSACETAAQDLKVSTASYSGKFLCYPMGLEK